MALAFDARERAEEARAQASEMKHEETRRIMLEIAAMYDRIADWDKAFEETLKDPAE